MVDVECSRCDVFQTCGDEGNAEFREDRNRLLTLAQV